MNRTVRKLTGYRDSFGLFLIAWVAYFSSYLGRLNLSAAMGGMAGEGFSKSGLGAVAATFFLAYGVGQLISGIVGDNVPPAIFAFLGLGLSGACNLAFGFAHGIAAMKVLWLLNGLAQSCIWGPISRLISERLLSKHCGRAVLWLSTTGPAGMFVAYGLSGVLLRFWGWRSCFLVPAAILLLVAPLWLVRVSRLQKTADDDGILEEPAAPLAPHPKKVRTGWLLSTGLLSACAAACLHGMLKDGLSTWIPTYLGESFSTGAGLSAALTALMPIVNLGGVFAVAAVNRRFFHNERRTTAAAFGFAFLIFALLDGFYGRSLMLTVLLLALCTTAMSGVNTMLISLIPLHYRREGRVSSVSGLLNSSAYLGSALASSWFGVLADSASWPMVHHLWCAIAAAGILCGIQDAKKWAAFRTEGLG